MIGFVEGRLSVSKLYIFFFYVREINLTESKVFWFAKCYIFGIYVLISGQFCFLFLYVF